MTLNLNTSSNSKTLMIEIIEPDPATRRQFFLKIMSLKKAQINLNEIKNNLKILREQSIKDLRELIDQFLKSARDRQLKVYFAESSEQAADFVLEIAKKTRCNCIHINNSSAAETIKDEIIKLKDIEVVNTYTTTIPKWKEERAHIKKKLPPKYYADLFQLPEELVYESFKIHPKNIEKFNYTKAKSKDYIGLLGVTSASADGALIYLQHMENISDVIKGAKALVHIVPIEKIVRDKDAAMFIAKCCGTFGFRTILSYVNSILTGTVMNRTGLGAYKPQDLISLEQPKDNYILLFDGGRGNILKDYRELLYCISCKACKSPCPWIQLEERKYIPRDLITPRDLLCRIYSKMEADANVISRDLYDCSMCNSCKINCPMELDLPQICMEMRSRVVESGYPPKTVKNVLISTYKYGNPWNMPQREAERWCENLRIKKAREERVDTLLFLCCALSFDPELQIVAKSLAMLLEKLGVDFCILGAEAKCCGEHILRLGEKGLFEELRGHNTMIINKYKPRQIITISPHCYHAFKHLYPDLKNVSIKHYTEFLLDIFEERDLNFTWKAHKAKIVYHDPCLLGRYNNIYEEPRKLLKLIDGIELFELSRNKINSFCCGAGGGRYWIEEPIEKRISLNRASEIASFKPDIVATSCPFCERMLTDAFKTINREQIEVKDILELLNDALIVARAGGHACMQELKA